MATKDFSATEDKELHAKQVKKEAPEDGVSEQASSPTESASVKDAHATGDGSFGRNDESLPEKEPQERPVENPY